jgi:hypothetical protein
MTTDRHVREDAVGRTVSGWRALRSNPTHAPELAVLYALPLLSPGVSRWHSRQPSHDSVEEKARLARRTIGRSIGLARRVGVIVGSSFYVGMPSALAVTYFEQLIVVLRVGAIYGRDPGDPARAAELLVLQGRYSTLDLAEAALVAARVTSVHADSSAKRGSLAVAIRQLPSMIGLQIRKLAPAQAVLGVLTVVVFLIPVISIPFWAYANGIASRRLGRAAINYYKQDPASGGVSPLSLPAPPPRRRLVAGLVAAGIALGALAAVIPLGFYSRTLPLGGLVLAEVGLVLTMLRLIRITRPQKAT